MTAVEWLEKELLMLDDNGRFFSFLVEKIYYQEQRKSLIYQAKEMEKKQIVEAMDISQRTDFYVEYEGSEDYYNKNFKNK